jgi:LytS/YehU family sensor histidine kinase
MRKFLVTFLATMPGLLFGMFTGLFAIHFGFTDSSIVWASVIFAGIILIINALHELPRKASDISAAQMLMLGIFIEILAINSITIAISLKDKQEIIITPIASLTLFLISLTFIFLGISIWQSKTKTVNKQKPTE